MESFPRQTLQQVLYATRYKVLISILQSMKFGYLNETFFSFWEKDTLTSVCRSIYNDLGLLRAQCSAAHCICPVLSSMSHFPHPDPSRTCLLPQKKTIYYFI